MSLRIGFHGGAQTVTGSRYLLESERARILVDCGLFQGLKELRLRNWQPMPFSAAGLDAVVLTHAHIDHSGYLPRLVREGFRGPIFCTEATLELAKILLPDAARLQEEDADYANRKGFSKHHPALPLFTEEDAQRAISQIHPLPFHELTSIKDFDFRFHQAGHILGAAFIELTWKPSAGEPHRLVFSGDIGRYDDPLHVDPEAPPAVDTLIMESTYGDRKHARHELEHKLREPFLRTFASGGAVLIPAFAVARAQLVLYLLGDLIKRGRLPQVPIDIDSPMASDVTALYRRFASKANLDVSAAALTPPGTHLHRSVEESKALNLRKGPRIIISASGMLTGGRVIHHLKRLMPDPKNLIVLVGYQAAGTRGRALEDGAKTLRMHGQDVPVRAPFIRVDELSAHGDADDLVRWLRSAPVDPGQVFLVHGEAPSLEALSGRLAQKGLKVITPELHAAYELDAAGKWQRQPGASEVHRAR